MSEKQKIQILDIYGKVLFECQAESKKDALIAAVLFGADLSGADLSGAVLSGAVLFGADLSGADLSGAVLFGADLSRADLSGAVLSGAVLFGADLSGADLSRADLSGAVLSGADLSRADLSGAVLSGAVLSGADLSGADLSRADLSGAVLSGADLSRAVLSGARLSRADLSGAKNISKYLTTPLYLLLDQPDMIRAYKLVNADGIGPFNWGLKCVVGETVSTEETDTDESHQCGKGINLATLDWVMKEWRSGYRILIAEFMVKDIACIPFASDGKFRVFRCKIVGEKDLEELGLIKKVEVEK